MSTPTCSHPREPLSLYLDGAGGPLLRMRMALRLRRCAACRAAFAELRTADQWVAAVTIEPSPGLEEALLARARELRPESGAAPAALPLLPSRPRWRWLPVAGTAAATVVIAVGLTNGWFSPRPADDLLYSDLALFEEMELIARLDMVEHFDEIQGVRLD